MKALKVFFLNIIIVISVLSCFNDNSEIVTEQSLEYFEELNVSYGTDSDQKFDIYLPANRTLNTRVMILMQIVILTWYAVLLVQQTLQIRLI